MSGVIGYSVGGGALDAPRIISGVGMGLGYASSTASGPPFLAAARSRSGSDSPPGCHSTPSRRFATHRGRLPRTARGGRSKPLPYSIKSGCAVIWRVDVGIAPYGLSYRVGAVCATCAACNQSLTAYRAPFTQGSRHGILSGGCFIPLQSRMRLQLKT